jgi:hypothetical protein
MPSSIVKVAETTSYNGVCATPFTRIHGRPTRQDYKLLKKEASDLASEVDTITFAWSRDTATGEEYGLLAEIIGDPSHQPKLGTRNGTHFIRSSHHSGYSDTHAKENGRRMGRETHIVVHPKRIPSRSHHEHARRARRAVLFAAKKHQHSLPKHHTDSNSKTSRYAMVPTRRSSQEAPQSRIPR